MGPGRFLEINIKALLILNLQALKFSVKYKTHCHSFHEFLVSHTIVI